MASLRAFCYTYNIIHIVLFIFFAFNHTGETFGLFLIVPLMEILFFIGFICVCMIERPKFETGGDFLVGLFSTPLAGLLYYLILLFTVNLMEINTSTQTNAGIRLPF